MHIHCIIFIVILSIMHCSYGPAARGMEMTLFGHNSVTSYGAQAETCLGFPGDSEQLLDFQKTVPHK